MRNQHLFILFFGLITLLILLFPPYIFKDTGQFINYDASYKGKLIPSFEKFDFLFSSSLQNAVKDEDNFQKYLDFKNEIDASYLYNEKNIQVIRVDKWLDNVPIQQKLKTMK